MSSSGSASSTIVAVPSRRPDTSNDRCRSSDPVPSSSAKAGNIIDVTAVPIPKANAKSFAAGP